MKRICILASVMMLLLCGCDRPSLEHYWDDYDFSSEKAFSPIEAAQERFAGYLELLEKTDTAKAAASMRGFLDKAAADTVSYLVYSDFFISAFYPLDSPYHDVELLRIYLRQAIADSIALDYLRFDEEEMLRKSYLNQPGSIAWDGNIILADGSEAGVLEIAAASSRTVLLLVGQAGCQSCVEMMKHLEGRTPKRTRLIAVVEKDFRGESKWLREQLSERWTVGTAGKSFLEGYDFDLAPARYTLDRNGKVLSLK